MIERQVFLYEELGVMAVAVGTTGRTPWQTVSRILQEIRDDGLIAFLSTGNYLLLDAAFDAETEDFPDERWTLTLRRANSSSVGSRLILSAPRHAADAAKTD